MFSVKPTGMLAMGINAAGGITGGITSVFDKPNAQHVHNSRETRD